MVFLLLVKGSMRTVPMLLERGEEVVKRFLRFNLKLSPAYLVLALIFVIGILLTGDEETYTTDMATIIAQITLILIFPNIFYMVKYRKEKGSYIGLLSIVPLIPVPFALIAVIMKVIYV
jgi:ABC-type Na+ efflux pump permease subunit